MNHTADELKAQLEDYHKMMRKRVCEAEYREQVEELYSFYHQRLYECYDIFKRLQDSGKYDTGVTVVEWKGSYIGFSVFVSPGIREISGDGIHVMLFDGLSTDELTWSTPIEDLRQGTYTMLRIFVRLMGQLLNYPDLHVLARKQLVKKPKKRKKSAQDKELAKSPKDSQRRRKAAQKSKPPKGGK